MNPELQQVYEWTKAIKITVNLEKSHVFIIPPKSTLQIPSVKVYIRGGVEDTRLEAKAKDRPSRGQGSRT